VSIAGRAAAVQCTAGRWFPPARYGTAYGDDTRTVLVTQFLLVCLAGALGTGARFAMTRGLIELFGTSFPFGTIAVNVLGSFLMAGVSYASTATDLVGPTLRLVLMTGFLGGFTTYSAFNNETLALVQQSLWGRALANVGVTLGVCLIAGLAGMVTARRLLG
jgi:fluoride exporter